MFDVVLHVPSSPWGVQGIALHQGLFRPICEAQSCDRQHRKMLQIGKKYSHLCKPDSRACVDPSSGKIHHLHLIRGQESMRLAVSDRDHVLSITFDVISFDILACSPVEEIF